LVAEFTSHPFVPVRSQSRVVPAHAAQVLDMHDWLVVHAVGQPPQCRLSVVVVVSQPFPGMPSQSAWPAGQASTQTPLAQNFPAAQGLLQPPQCWFDEFVSVSHPFAVLPSQLP
jgi:hypothetical protein